MRNAKRRVDHVVVEVDEARDVHVPLGRALRSEVADGIGRAVDVLIELERRDGGVSAVDRDQRVRHGAETGRAPPLALLVGGYGDCAADVGRVARSGLGFVGLVTGAEHDHGLSVRGCDDVAGVRSDARAFGERTEVERLEMSERRVLAFDMHHRLVRTRDLTVIERRHRQVLPARLP